MTFKGWLREKEDKEEAEDAAKAAEAQPDAEENPQTRENAELAIRSIYDTINRKIVKDPDPMINYVIKLIHRWNFSKDEIETWNREGLGNLEDELDKERQSKVDQAAAKQPEGEPGDAPNEPGQKPAPQPPAEKKPSKEESEAEQVERKKAEKEQP